MGISIEQWRSTIGLFECISFRGIHGISCINLYLNLLLKTFKLFDHFIVSVRLIALKMVIENIYIAHFSFIIVLFGDEHLSVEDNKILFKGIQT